MWEDTLRVLLAMSIVMIIQSCSAKPERLKIAKNTGDAVGEPGIPPIVVSGDDEPAVKCDGLDTACLALRFRVFS